MKIDEWELLKRSAKSPSCMRLTTKFWKKHGNLKRTCYVLASHGIEASHEEGIDNTELKSSKDFMFQSRNSAAFPPSMI